MAAVARDTRLTSPVAARLAGALIAPEGTTCDPSHIQDTILDTRCGTLAPYTNGCAAETGPREKGSIRPRRPPDQCSVCLGYTPVRRNLCNLKI